MLAGGIPQAAFSRYLSRNGLCPDCVNQTARAPILRTFHLSVEMVYVNCFPVSECLFIAPFFRGGFSCWC